MPRIQWDPKVTLGNVLTILTLLATLATAYINLKLDVAKASAEISDLQAQVEPVGDLTTRMAVVERNQVVGRQDRIDFQEDIAARVEDLRKQNLQILTSLAAIMARLEERDSP